MRFGLPHWLAFPEMTTGDWIGIVGDAIVFFALVLTVSTLIVESNRSIRREIVTALEVLHGVKDGMSQWSYLHFSTDYSGAAGDQRADVDRKLVQGGGYMQNFRVPEAPLVSLIQQPGTGLLIDGKTIEAANVALWKIGIFNQLVQQQADFNTLHLSEYADPSVDQDRHNVLAEAAARISAMIHKDGIGDASWHSIFMSALDSNIAKLDRLDRGHWRILRRPSEPLKSPTDARN
jgi:hypothetical protein